MSMRQYSTAFSVAALLLGGQFLNIETVAAETHVLTVLIENVSSDTALKLPSGTTKRAPVAPGAYAVVRAGTAMFEAGKPAGPNGLESLAEDGNAEAMIAYLMTQEDVRESGLFLPGQPFVISISPEDRLVFATMFVESNDLFYAPNGSGIALHDAAGRPLVGDFSTQVYLWDAGTEVNEVPGAGPNQAPRQTKPGSGPAEQGVVQMVDDKFEYPRTAEVIRVTITSE